MKGTSPRVLAVYVALIATVIEVVGIFIQYFAGIIIPWWATIIVIVVSFSAIYFLVYYILSDFIYEKINPIYKTIHNYHLGKRRFRKAMEDNKLITSVESEVSTWAQGKSKEIDQLKQLEKYRREFLGNVSHELKTPIFSIQGYILTLLDGGLEDSSINRQYLERTEKSINRMINIVEDLESISRLESGELKLNYENFNIVSLVEDVYEMQEMLARRYGVKLQFGEGHDKIIRVHADRKRIVEAVNNLILNSIKYSKTGGNTSVSFVDIGDQVLVSISDSGIGIAEHDLPRIFERFYRVDKSRSRDQGGTGLGLSIVKHIMEAHHQTIRVQSKQGEGTTFTFTLDKSKFKRGGDNK
jgi:two-component system, OmpR family, phosphate regulon sensor histidine kinase PhoR